MKANRLLKGICILALMLLVMSAFRTINRAEAAGGINYWYNAGTGTLTISGSGPMGYVDGPNQWRFYYNTAKSIVISEGITSIGIQNFMSFGNVTTVKLPSTLTEIGESAFQGCGKLTSVNMPAKLTSIGRMAFNGDSALKSVTLPNGLKTIGYGAFQYCTSLTSVIIPDSVTSLGSSVFDSCEKLKSVRVGKGVQVLDTAAFGACKALTSVTLSDGLKSINSSTFVGCSALTAIKLPASVTSVDNHAFDRCSGLTAFTVAPGSSFKVIDGILYDGAGTQMILCPPGKTSAVIPEGVTSLKRDAFDTCTKLTSVKLPKSLKKLDWSFNYCDALTSVDFGGVESITNSFTWPKALVNVTIPGTVKSINWSFQQCPALSSVTLGEGVEMIYGSFTYSALKTVALPQSLKSIGASFYEGKMTSVYIPGTTAVDNSFNGNGTISDLFIGQGTQKITRSFNNCNLKKLLLSDSITDITASFEKCSALNDVYFLGPLPSMLTSPYYPPQFGKTAVLHYLDGQTGWTTPKYESYTTEPWALAQPTLDHFSTGNVSYNKGMFSDVDENAWYGENGTGIVGTAVRLGIMSGTGNGKFSPTGQMTIAQALKMADVVNDIYNGGSGVMSQSSPWYQVYVDYALAHSIIKSGDFSDYNAVATRAQLAYIFSNAVPAEALQPIHNVTSIPDA